MGKLRSNYWAFFKNDHDEWLRHFLGKLWKKPPSSFRNLFKMCLMGILMGSFRTYSQFAHWSSCDQSAGLFSKKFKICLLGMWWVNCLKDHKKITICPPGFLPLCPQCLWNGISVVNQTPQHSFHTSQPFQYPSGWVLLGLCREIVSANMLVASVPWT